MKLRELKSGTRITQDLVLNSLLESQQGIARYLGTRSGGEHCLIHVLPSFSEDSIDVLCNSARVGNEILNNQAECGSFEEFLYLVEDFPLGEYLFEWLERRERVPVTEALRRIIEMLKLLSRAHGMGVFHGRITPKSVLLERTGVAYSLRLMGLGVSQAMTKSMQFNLDWFDYSFDLEGMEAVEVDVYGVAIILMGMVTGEAGIDSFEATGLMPQGLRGGLLQLALERALALSPESYPNCLAFMQDLEAAYLELDEKQVEMFVGDLVGFESAIRNVMGAESLKEKSSDYSGVWNAVVNDLADEERSSVLHSLTSLAAIKQAPERASSEEDDEQTRITAMPSGVFGFNRIHSMRTDDLSDDTLVLARPTKESLKQSAEAPHVKKDTPPLSQEERIAQLKALETHEEEDDSPTRIMNRPNYRSISLTSQEGDGVISAMQAALDEANLGINFRERIRRASVEVLELAIRPTFYYSDLFLEDEADERAKEALIEALRETAQNEVVVPEKLPSQREKVISDTAFAAMESKKRKNLCAKIAVIILIVFVIVILLTKLVIL